EVVATLFGVGLVAREVVDGRGDLLAGLFAGTHGMDGVADGQQGLDGHHQFVVFDEIAGQYQNLACHCRLLRKGGRRAVMTSSRRQLHCRESTIRRGSSEVLQGVAMCNLYSGQDPANYETVKRSVRLNG